MKVQEIMERAGMSETGRSIAYIKDALEEMNLISETHIQTERLDIVSNKRFYNFPKNMIKILDIRCKNHDANDGTYKSIPRTIYEPATEDTDGF
jgi:DNA-binding transcriptional regulator GbsR (MarR family)